MYFVAIVILSSLGVVGVLAVTLIRPSADNTSIIVTIIGFLTPSIGAMLAGMLKETHATVNGRMDELLNLTKKSSYAEGRLDSTE